LLLIASLGATVFPLFLPTLPALLLEFADLLIEKTSGLLILPAAEIVMPAVRAASPPLGVRVLAGRTENAFWQRHRWIGAHCTLRAVDEDRRRTLLTLMYLAEGDSPTSCWDDRRAVDLLRRQSTAEELRELGMDEAMIRHVFEDANE
jgi:hypothetical protein